MSIARAIELLDKWIALDGYIGKLDLEKIRKELEEPDDLRARVERLEAWRKEQEQPCERRPTGDRLPEAGTRLVTLPVLGDTKGFLIAQKNLDNRRPSMECVYMYPVPGHGGDVWWCRHQDGSVAAYSYTEVKFK